MIQILKKTALVRSFFMLNAEDFRDMYTVVNNRGVFKLTFVYFVLLFHEKSSRMNHECVKEPIYERYLGVISGFNH